MLKILTFAFASILFLAACDRDRGTARQSDSTNLVDWGVVELSVSTPKRLSLGEGKDCTITAVSATNGHLEIRIETKEKIAGGDLPPGVPLGTSLESTKTMTMTVPSGGQLMTSIGLRPVRFTPILKGP